jgi:hypothetical protein
MAEIPDGLPEMPPALADECEKKLKREAEIEEAMTYAMQPGLFEALSAVRSYLREQNLTQYALPDETKYPRLCKHMKFLFRKKYYEEQEAQREELERQRKATPEYQIGEIDKRLEYIDRRVRSLNDEAHALNMEANDLNVKREKLLRESRGSGGLMSKFSLENHILSRLDSIISRLS